MEQIEIRPIQGRDELEACFDLWATVFPENRAFFQERLDHDPNYTEETTWLAKVDGELAAAVQIFPFYTSLEGCLLKVGGIGSVATLPNYRGRSLTQLILQRQSEWMVRKGYDLSLLFTGINPFYEKVGWETVKHTSYSLESQKALSFLSTKVELERLYNIKPFDSHYLEQVKEVYDSFTNVAFGQAIRTPEYWKGQLKWLKEEADDFLVALIQDQVVAYLRLRKGREDVLELTECCYKAGHELASLSLLEVALKRQTNGKLKAAVPESHALYPFLAEAGAEPQEECYAMWKLLSLPLLFTKLKEVFAQRLKVFSLNSGENLQTSLLIQSGGEDVLLHIHNCLVDVEKPTDYLKYQLLYKRKPAELLSDLINGTSSDHRTTKVLFPKRDYLFWKTDSF